MRVTEHATVQGFLEVAWQTLMRAEAANNLILGIAGRLAKGHGYGSEAPYFLTVSEDDALLAAAVRTPPHPVIVHCEDDRPDAVERIVDHLKLSDPELPGVNGTVKSAALFAELWARKVGVSAEIAMRLRIFELRKVTPPTGVPGRMRLADCSDVPLLAEWVEAFREEAVPHDPPKEPRAVVQRFMDPGTLVVWDDGGVVSMAGSSRSSERGATIALVYTPPELRGRGYASACVAGLSQLLLDRGYAFCALFTDLSNPTSNRIYRRIGYCPVADWNLYRW